MGFSRNTIYQALQETENNQIKVAYQLVVDHKRMVLAGGISGQKSFLATSPPSWNSLKVTIIIYCLLLLTIQNIGIHNFSF